MSEAVKTQSDSLTRLALRVAIPGIISIAICIGSALATSVVLTGRLEERLTGLKDSLDKHDATRQEEILRLTARTENHEQRLTRLEAHFDTVQETLGEIRSDVKIILRGGQQ